MGKVIRVLLADDHPVVRSGIRAELDGADGIEVVGEASSGDEALRLVEELRPDVLVLDVVMPGMDGVEATRLLRERHPDLRILALSAYDDEQHIFGRTVLIVASLGFVVILAYGLLSDASILYPSLALSPFLVNGLLSLVPVRAVLGSDGANMVAMARQLELGPFQFLKESLRSVGLIANYLGRHTLARVHVRHALLLGIVVACGLLLTTS